MGRLTTHILDTAGGIPAAGVSIRLYALAESRELIAAATTNDDGRTDKPLAADEAFSTGTYELEFDIGDYFGSRGQPLAEPPFLDVVVIRFSADASQHYHVPLLASPWSYSTYRGS